MTPVLRQTNRRLELADILRQHIADYQKRYPLPALQRRIVADLLNCRTATLGGQLQRCPHCGHQRIQYHSCRNRHCPTCQHLPRERWLAARTSELLPTAYFHVVFTLPHALNPIILKHKVPLLNTLFAAVSETLLVFGQNKLGGRLGFISILHTWDQKLTAHFHLHCLVAGGVISADWNTWSACPNRYLFNAQALSQVFRGKFMARLTHAVNTHQIALPPNSYPALNDRLYANPWVVSVRPPIRQPQHVLEYLARYTYRVAISNQRLVELKDGQVTFRYKDRQNHQNLPLTLEAVEFIRRFLLHGLPAGFVRIRHYGFLANRYRHEHLAKIKHAMALPTQSNRASDSLPSMMLSLTGIDITLCPNCRKASLQTVAEIPKISSGCRRQIIRAPTAVIRVAA